MSADHKPDTLGVRAGGLRSDFHRGAKGRELQVSIGAHRLASGDLQAGQFVVRKAGCVDLDRITSRREIRNGEEAGFRCYG